MELDYGPRLVYVKNDTESETETEDLIPETGTFSIGTTSTITPNLILLNINHSDYQDTSFCSNCYAKLPRDSVGSSLSLSDELFPKELMGDDVQEISNLKVTVLEALDIIFEVRKKSNLSKIILDDSHYKICRKCTRMLRQLFQAYVELTKSSQLPSFLMYILVQNLPLKRYLEPKAQHVRKSSRARTVPVLLNFETELHEDSEGENDPSWGDDYSNGDERAEKINESDSDSDAKAESGMRRVAELRARRKRLQEQLAQKQLSKLRQGRGKATGKRMRKYPCLECAAKFLRSNDLQTHARVHSEKNFSCDKCDGGFKTKNFLERHVTAFHSYATTTVMDEPTTRSSGSVKISVNVQTLNKKEHRCTECGKECPSASKLARHASVHSKAASGRTNRLTPLRRRPDESDHGGSDEGFNREEDQPELESEQALGTGPIKSASTQNASKRKRKYKCPECPARFLRSDHTTRHIPVHAEKNHHCLVCKAGFVTLTFLERHLTTVHKEGGQSEDEAAKLSGTVAVEEKRGRSVSVGVRNTKAYKCDEPNCDAVFTRSNRLTSHLERVHRKVKPAAKGAQGCSICGLILRSELKLKKHMNKHRPTVDESQYTCEFCGRSYLNKDSLRKHKVSHRDGKRLACEVCGYTTPYKYMLSRHTQLVHVGTRAHICPSCGMSFKTQHQLRLHMVKHEQTEVRPFACTHPGCTKAFRRQTNLHQHLQLHKGAKWICDQCGAAFSRNGYLQVHKKAVHLGLPVRQPTRRRKKGAPKKAVRPDPDASGDSGSEPDHVLIISTDPEEDVDEEINRHPPYAHQFQTFTVLSSHLNIVSDPHFVPVPAHSEFLY